MVLTSYLYVGITQLSDQHENINHKNAQGSWERMLQTRRQNLWKEVHNCLKIKQ